MGSAYIYELRLICDFRNRMQLPNWSRDRAGPANNRFGRRLLLKRIGAEDHAKNKSVITYQV